jgi:hypothetical protein
MHFTKPFTLCRRQAAIIHGYKQLRKVVNDPALSHLLVREVFPGTNVTSDDDLWHAIQEGSLTFHHPVSQQSLHRQLVLILEDSARHRGFGHRRGRQDMARQGITGHTCD